MNDPSDPPLRFGVLGPLRVWQGDNLVDLGPDQQRVVLAVLCLQAGRPIGRQQMIDAVWGGAPPTHAVNLVQRHVSRLRRALNLDRSTHGAASKLIWTDAGYLFTLPTDALDLGIFDREVARARGARVAGNMPEAAEALHAALGLWRGPLCDGLSSPFLDAQRVRLAESRIGLIEERIELDLAIGEHSDMIAELRELVAEHPLRERLHGLLMLALYRAGRQADGLAAFRAARRQLHEELGVEPSAPLQRLHQQILAADPQLIPAGTAQVMISGSAETTYGRPVPAQLPHSIPDFTGREAEIEMLNALLPGDGADRGPVIIATVAGTAGVGKTALAIHWSQEIRDHFPDGQLYVDLRGFDPAGPAMNPAEAVRGFLDAFAVPPDRIPVDLDAQGALYRSILADLRVLIVLDNARDGSQVRPLLPGSAGCFVVVTSRSQLIDLAAMDAAHSVSIDLLPPSEARQLLLRRLGPERVAAEPAAVDEIIGACAGLPLALSVVTARAAANPRLLLAGLAEELGETYGGLDALDGGDTRTNIRAVFSWSYRALSAPAARFFRLLGIHTGPDIGVAAAASLAGETPARARALLTELTRAHLLTQRSHRRFVFHDLLRAYSRELAERHDSAAERRAALNRLLDHYLYSAYRADELLRPGRDETIMLTSVTEGASPQPLSDHREALIWFDTEYQVLLAALRQAVREGFDVYTWQLAWTLMSFFDRHCHWHDAAASQRVALDAANRLGDLHGQAVSHASLAYAYIRLSRHEDAQPHLVRALQLYEELSDKTGQAQAHQRFAWAFDQLGEYRQALLHSERALELSRAVGQRTGQARALNAIGWFHLKLGDPEEALLHCQQALAMQREIGDRFYQANTLDSIAGVYHRLGRHEEAATHYLEALDLYHDFGDLYSEAETWVGLGDTYLAADDPASASAAWRNALAILDDLGHPDAAHVRGKLQTLKTTTSAST
jgi:DNA-binding SARP family transcriptional activator/tetratricopeptide (TPR) repeat protein